MDRLAQFAQGLASWWSGEQPYDFEAPKSYLPTKFEFNDPSARKYFEENGYVVFKQIATPEETAKALDLFWELAEACVGSCEGIKRDDPSTWDAWVADPSSGIMAAHGIGQSKFQWYCRTIPKVKQIFELIWGTNDLLVSYDGAGVFRPPDGGERWRTFGGWYHVDQNCYKKQGLHAVQGLLNVISSGPNDGGFVVVPRSHLLVEAAFTQKDDLTFATSGDFIRINPQVEFWQEAVASITKRDDKNRYDFLPVKLVLDAGDFVMWDSRSIHCNAPAGPSANEEAKRHLRRLAAYICMTPAASAKDLEEVVNLRIEAFQRGTTTTHWPHEFRPSWKNRDHLTHFGSKAVVLTLEQSKLITGEKYAQDVYVESTLNSKWNN